MVFSKNYICTELEPFEDIFENGVSTDTDSDAPDEEEVATFTPSGEPNKCIVCNDLPANTGLLPCMHMKFCNECVLKMKALSLSNGSNVYSCPYCRAEVHDSLLFFT